MPQFVMRRVRADMNHRVPSECDKIMALTKKKYFLRFRIALLVVLYILGPIRSTIKASFDYQEHIFDVHHSRMALALEDYTMHKQERGATGGREPQHSPSHTRRSQTPKDSLSISHKESSMYKASIEGKSDARIPSIPGRTRRGAARKHQPRRRNASANRLAMKISMWKQSRIRVPKAVPPPGFDSVKSFTDFVVSLHASNQSTFQPKLLPLLQQKEYTKTLHKIAPIPVLFWPLVASGVQTAEHLHLGLDGVEESPYLKMANNISDFTNPDLVWVVDVTYQFDCRKLVRLVVRIMAERYEGGYPTQWPIYMIDFGDSPYRQRCPIVEHLMGENMLRYSARLVTAGRKFSEESKWIEYGHTVGNLPQRVGAGIIKGIVYQHTPLMVRTDIVEALQRLLWTNYSMELFESIEEIPRQVDVTHVWPLDQTDDTRSKINEQYGSFRNKVSCLLHRYGQELGWKTHIGLFGKGIVEGRRTVMSSYVQGMLETKIVVVTQRDCWEDHYRLQESLISGAMVVSDYMHGLPSGLKNGTSLLLFKTEEDLKSIISYYLKNDRERSSIAKEGRRIAMSRHRSWHRMEEIILGSALSTCDNPEMKNEQCPFMAHHPVYQRQISAKEEAKRLSKHIEHQRSQSLSNRPPPMKPLKEPRIPEHFAGHESEFWKFIQKRAERQQLPDIYLRIQKKNFTGLQPVPIVLWPLAVTSKPVTAEHRHLGYNGISESKFLQAVDNISDVSHPDLMWVVDSGWGFKCEELLKWVKTAMIQRYSNGFPLRWPIVIVDFSDGPYRQRCRHVEELMGSNLVSYTARSVTRKRQWSDERNWVDLGEYFGNISAGNGVHYHHTPLAVRTDIVEALQVVLETRHRQTLADPIENLPRKFDVQHVWPLSLANEDKNKINKQHGNLRNRVSQLIHDYAQEFNWEISLDLRGHGIQKGRHNVQSDYIESMLESKIIVVTQRDSWEDHYRLFESMVSGAMVFSDHMFGLPEGLRNGTSIIMFTGPDDLKALLSYYLEHEDERLSIAKEGRRIAMSRHRSWHRMEECVFGEVLSTCRNLGTLSSCPYTVHNEMALSFE